MNFTESDRDKKCADLYAGEKSKSFMLHLVRAYALLQNVKPVRKFKEGQRSRCATCGAKLADFESMLNVGDTQIVTDEMMDDLITKVDVNHDMVTGNLRIAFEGDETSTCMCADCVKAVNKFAINACAAGDPSVNRTVSSMRDKALGVDHKPKYRYQSSTEVQTLADLPGFSKLLEKNK
jgi:hypothetical protein